jgi:hypothetical protein
VHPIAAETKTGHDGFYSRNSGSRAYESRRVSIVALKPLRSKFQSEDPRNDAVSLASAASSSGFTAGPVNASDRKSP